MALLYGQNYGGAALGLCVDVGSQTAQQIDTTYAFEGGAGNEAFWLKFVSPVSQTNAALDFHAFATAVTGSPSFSGEIREASTVTFTKPITGGSALGSLVAAQTPAANTWSSWAWTGVTLTAGTTYFIIIYNSSGDPTTAYASWCYRGAIDAHNGIFTTTAGTSNPFRSGFTTDGFSTPTITTGTGTGCGVIKFGDGTIMGFPWVATSAHPSDANDRGIRVNFTEDVTVLGALYQVGSPTTAWINLEIFTSSGGTPVGTYALDVNGEQSGGTLFAPITLTGGVDYDIVLTTASGTHGLRGYMGEAAASLPADVLACRPSWFLGFVGGSTTPGSMTLTVELAAPFLLLLDNNPAIAGGGGMLVHPGMGGRLV